MGVLIIMALNQELHKMAIGDFVRRVSDGKICLLSLCGGDSFAAIDISTGTFISYHTATCKDRRVLSAEELRSADVFPLDWEYITKREAWELLGDKIEG